MKYFNITYIWHNCPFGNDTEFQVMCYESSIIAAINDVEARALIDGRKITVTKCKTKCKTKN